jgi:hypothetical protein
VLLTIYNTRILVVERRFTIYNREVLRRLRLRLRLRLLLKDTFCLYIAQKRFFYVSHINYKIINLINCLIKYSLNEISN